MKKIVLNVVLIIVLSISILAFTGCTLKIETSDNTVSASVDGDTTERVDSILDWIKARLSRIFKPSEGENNDTTTTTTQTKSTTTSSTQKI